MRTQRISKKLLIIGLVALIFTFSSAVVGQAVLSPGDLAIVGFNTSTNELAVVALASISAGETVFITDRGWGGPSPATDFNNTNTFVEGLLTGQPPACLLVILSGSH